MGSKSSSWTVMAEPAASPPCLVMMCSRSTENARQSVDDQGHGDRLEQCDSGGQFQEWVQSGGVSEFLCNNKIGYNLTWVLACAIPEAHIASTASGAVQAVSQTAGHGF